MQTGLELPESLRQRCLGRTDIIQRVLKAFACQLRKDLHELSIASQADDFPLIAKIAHRIKGAAANTGIERIVHLASKMEDAIVDLDDLRISQLHIDLVETSTDFLKLLPEWEQSLFTQPTPGDEGKARCESL